MKIIKKIINWLNRDVKYINCKCCKRKFIDGERTYGHIWIGGGFCLSCMNRILK